MSFVFPFWTLWICRYKYSLVFFLQDLKSWNHMLLRFISNDNRSRAVFIKIYGDQSVLYINLEYFFGEKLCYWFLAQTNLHRPNGVLSFQIELKVWLACCYSVLCGAHKTVRGSWKFCVWVALCMSQLHVLFLRNFHLFTRKSYVSHVENCREVYMCSCPLSATNLILKTYDSYRDRNDTTTITCALV